MTAVRIEDASGIEPTAQLLLQREQALSTEPEVRPAPLSALGLAGMPTELHFVRSHFGIPTIEPETWVVELVGAVAHPLRLSLDDLRRRRPSSRSVVLECAGHRRNELQPATPGLQWGPGAVSEAHWAGVSLSDLLAEAKPSRGACEVVFQGADRGPHRSSAEEVPFSRSIAIERALSGDVLLAWSMNGSPIPAKHGGPLRAIAPGSYAVDSVKWLTQIEVLEQPFSGPFQAVDYRVRDIPEADGNSLPDLPVNALILAPESGAVVPGGTLELSGVAWGGCGGIAAVEVRTDGAEWEPATIASPRGPTGFTRWSSVLLAAPGPHTVEVRARDRADRTQPKEPSWNALGYANNSIHRISLVVRDRQR
jgi:DMSO/TMAO reductase YedYZ molybdopterin-dependent catalytic subunit